MAFDEEEIDPHGECAHEITRLKAERDELLNSLRNAEIALRYCYDNGLPASDVMRPKVLVTADAFAALLDRSA